MNSTMSGWSAFRITIFAARRVLHRQDEAGGALRLLLHPHVEPDGAVEARLLMEDYMSQLVGEGLRLLLIREVAVLAAPTGDRAHHAVDERAHARLALDLPPLVVADRLRRQRPPEVLGGDDVRRPLRPLLGDIHVLLLEDGLPVLGDDGGAPFLPLYLVIGVDIRLREVPPYLQSRRRR